MSCCEGQRNPKWGQVGRSFSGARDSLRVTQWAGSSPPSLTGLLAHSIFNIIPARTTTLPPNPGPQGAGSTGNSPTFPIPGLVPHSELGKGPGTISQMPQRLGKHSGGFLSRHIWPNHTFRHHCLKPVVLRQRGSPAGSTSPGYLLQMWMLSPLRPTGSETLGMGPATCLKTCSLGVLVHTQV